MRRIVLQCVILLVFVLVTGFVRSSRQQIDNTLLPFLPDPDLLGTWRSVDLVKTIPDFTSGIRQSNRRLFVQTVVFQQDGQMQLTTDSGMQMGSPIWTWTRGKIIHHGGQTAADYFILPLDGRTYLFFEWKTGDYTIRHEKPWYYVLECAD